MILKTDYMDGNLTPSQVESVRHLESYAKHWFLWGLLSTKGKDRKSPQSPGGGPGRVNDPRTAGTLNEALTAMHDKQAGGVGLLVSTAVPGFIGLDLDNVIVNGVVHAFGLEAIERFKGGYVEVSPSGTGLRIFCLGELPAGIPKGSTAIQDGVKFEAYAAGTNRFLRTTGALVSGTVGKVVRCQEGLGWFASVMVDSKAGSPDNGNVQVTSSAGGLTLDAVFDALSELRDDKDSEAVIEEIVGVISLEPRGKIAEAWHGNLTQWKDDHSAADLFIACEAIRRGACSLVEVVEAWGASGLSKRPKFKRKDYVLATVDRAARAVLASQQSKSGARTKMNTPAPLPEGLAEALALSGDELRYTKGGRLEPTAGNVVILFRNDLRIAGVIAFNEFAQCAERVSSWRVFDRLGCDYPGPLSDDDISRVQFWLAANFGMNIRRDDLMKGLEAAALDAKYDPLADRLRELGLSWDGVPRISNWLVKYAFVDDQGCEQYVEAVSRMFPIAAVARALAPGCKMDTVLSVEGKAGSGKSAMFKVLADAVASGLFADGVQDASNPVAIVEGTDGAWLLELGELAAIRRASDVEALKSSITRTVEKIRRPYAAKSSLMPRRFVMVATTNSTGGYLADPSGALARRFWPVRTLASETRQIDLTGLSEVAGQLWGEAVTHYLAGAKWHLSESDGPAFSQWVAGRDLRREDGAYFNELYDYLCRWVADAPADGRSLTEIALGVGDIRTAEGGGVGSTAMQLAGTLTSMGMEKRKSGTSKWFFTPESANKFAAISDRAKRAASPKATKPTLRAA